jgi:hypothetical protein
MGTRIERFFKDYNRFFIRENPFNPRSSLLPNRLIQIRNQIVNVLNTNT